MSSGSDSDEEYVPGEPEQVSEEGSADEETDLQYEREFEQKTKKRKAELESMDNKKRKTRNGIKEIETRKSVEKKVELPEQVLDPDEKKREEDLWAKFLEGTDTKPKASTKEPNVNQSVQSTLNNIQDKTQNKEAQRDNDDKARARRIFEFAGEKIIVEDNVIKEKIKISDSPAVDALEGSSAPSRGSGGLSNLLGQLNKKNKLSTLEKSKLDWETYKKEEGIEEEVKSHNKGKAGYLDRQDFLERADVRQYEIERDLRLSRRSNR